MGQEDCVGDLPTNIITRNALAQYDAFTLIVLNMMVATWQNHANEIIPKAKNSGYTIVAASPAKIKPWPGRRETKNPVTILTMNPDVTMGMNRIDV